MGTTPYGITTPNIGEPGWGVVLNHAMDTLDTNTHSVSGILADATGTHSSLKVRIEDIEDEITEARSSVAFDHAYSNLNLRIEEGDAQIQYAKGPFTALAGEELRSSISSGTNENQGNSYLGNTQDEDLTDNTLFIVGSASPTTVSLDPNAGISYFNINGKIYSVGTAAITGGGGGVGYVLVSPASSGVGETEVSVRVLADITSIGTSDIPIGFYNYPDGYTFTRNKISVFVLDATITPAASDIITDESIYLGFPPDSIDVIARYIADTETRFISNPPSVQVVIKRHDFVDKMSITAKQVRWALDPISDTPCLIYDAESNEKIDIIRNLKVIFKYYGRPWRDSRQDF